MKVTATLRQQLIDSAREARDLAKKELAEAERNLAWAQAQRVGYPLTNYAAPVLTWTSTSTNTSTTVDFVNICYYVPSKSGLTKGHYIRKFGSGRIDCTCPGFVNRGYCWASTKISKDALDSFRYIWNKSRNLFNNNREAALRLAQV